MLKKVQTFNAQHTSLKRFQVQNRSSINFLQTIRTKTHFCNQVNNDKKIYHHVVKQYLGNTSIYFYDYSEFKVFDRFLIKILAKQVNWNIP